MQELRNCATCGKEFCATKINNNWCQRSCFKKAYYLRKKSEYEEWIKTLKNPSWKCHKCGFFIESLPYDPIKDKKLHEEWICPSCNCLPKDYWKDYVTQQVKV